MSTKRCPYCAEEIQEEAIKCRYCGEWLEKVSELEVKIDDSVPQTEIQPKVYIQPVEIDFNTENEIPRLQKQNFTLGKVVSVLLVLVGLSIYCVIYNIYHSRGDSEDKSMMIYYVLVFLLAAACGLSAWLLSILNKYLDNFEQYDNLQDNVKYLSIGILLCCIMPILIAAASYDKTSLIKLLSFVKILVFIYTIAMNVLTGWRLFRFENDYVGGLSALGFCMLLSFFLPIIWIIMPAMAFHVFYKAGEYATIYGFDEE